ncbi:MAG: hypothetical protein GY852_04755 [bacterium]|nr:hypothetical protein [bacterium]
MFEKEGVRGGKEAGWERRAKEGYDMRKRNEDRPWYSFMGNGSGGQYGEMVAEGYEELET